MYNYQAQPPYGQPPGYGGFPGQGPPGMGMPPGMSPPGMGGAPGMQAPQTPLQGNFPQQFQRPPNMPANMDFSAPVIRLGTTAPGRQEAPQGDRRDRDRDQGNRRGAGLGFEGRDTRRYQMQDQMSALAPPTREEIARTIFVGNITEGCGGDEGMQRILGVAGGLRRWTRCMDADGKPCTFGFAEYEDADSLRTASEVFKDVEVPKKKPATKDVKKEEGGVKKEEGGVKKEEDDEEEIQKVETAKLLVVIDENSQNYIEEWSSRGSLADPAQAEFRFDSAREELAIVLAGLSRPDAVNGMTNGFTDHDGDTTMQGTKIDTATGEVVSIPLNAEDELSDIPAEMRETVAKEIAAFRDRSVRRDIERLKKEEEMEAAEKQRVAGARVNRLASPPVSTPTGPAGVQGAPLGPRGFQGAQMPSDYRKGVSFVNGAGYTQEEEESDASDEEIERRRNAKRDAELEKMYFEQERRWLNREKSRTAAVEREKQRDKDDEANAKKEKATVAARLKEWNDDEEATRKVEEYYRDRSLWLRNRAAFRLREAEADDRDRAAEDRQQHHVQDHRSRDNGMADRFLAQQAEEMESRVPSKEPARFKMALGAAAHKAQAAAAPRRTIAEVEGLLEDEEEEEATTARRTLRPIAAEDMRGGAQMSEEERADAVRQLAKEIPNDKGGLWSWSIKWEFVDDAVITEQLRPFVERKVVEYLGVQEELLVDVVESTIKKRGSPQALVSELEGALDPEEAETLVRKLWRMLIFFSESEKRGLSG